MRSAWILIAAVVCATCASAQAVVAPDWGSMLGKSQTRITLQVVVNPPLRPGSPIHDAAWQSLAQLNAVDARFALWYPYPRLAVAEIARPTKKSTSWDFSTMDPLVEDFFTATKKRATVLTFSTIPQWMFETSAPVAVPADPDQAMWDYEQGTRLRDDSMEEISAYYERLARWYIRGNFVDELGSRHNSGHHYPVRYWEILNEPEYEHTLSAEYYTRIYDAVVSKLRRVSPSLRFVGMSLAEPAKGVHFAEYFLDSSHHVTGIPLDAISYHFYALGKAGESEKDTAASFFTQAGQFLDTVRNMDAVRRRLSPHTETQINEGGCIAPNDVIKSADSMNGKDISASYWNLCGAMFAYLYGNLAAQGIDVVGASQLLGYPGQYPSVTLLDWTSGLPNPRYRVLQLLLKHCHPGDALVSSAKITPTLYALAFRTQHGVRKILLVNETSGNAKVSVTGARGGSEEHVDALSKSSPPLLQAVSSDEIILHAYSVMMVTLPAVRKK
jgi:hypothetical protein